MGTPGLRNPLFCPSAAQMAPKDATNGLVSGRDETAENMKLLEVGSGPKLKDGKHGFSNMGPEEERVARFELLAEPGLLCCDAEERGRLAAPM